MDYGSMVQWFSSSSPGHRCICVLNPPALFGPPILTGALWVCDNDGIWVSAANLDVEHGSLSLSLRLPLR